MMKNSVLKTIRFTSFLLVILLFLPSFSLWAVEAPAAEVQSTVAEGVSVVSEDESKRTAFEKHYLLSDGTYYVVSYAEAVHEQDAQGNWVDVDAASTYDTASERVVTAYSDNTVIQSTYTSNTDLSDEWDLAYISTELPIDLEAQETIHTCWAAAARMFASVYNADSIPPQDGLTFEIREDFNKGATVSEMEEAIKLCLGLQSTDEEFALQEKVYSEENLQTILKSGHPLAVGILWYEQILNKDNIADGGHAIVLYGICETEEEEREYLEGKYRSEMRKKKKIANII